MILSHRCKCQHPDFFHNHRGECSFGFCDTRCRAPKLPDEPELLPTFRWDGRQSVLVEETSEPGTKIGPMSAPITLCNCDRCCAIFNGEVAA